jgi:hypothetical protein
MSEQKEAIVAELQEAIDRYGVDAGPKVVRDRHPGIPRASWFRYLKAARATPLDRAISVARAASADLSDVLPAPLSPAIIAAKPVETRRALDFLGSLKKIEADIELLREFAIKRDADGKESVKNPVFFASQTKLSLDVLDKYLAALRELYNFEKIQEFFNVIIETIRQVDPGVASKIMDRLYELDQARGFTLNARPV